jgi:Ala-tRNA(Pro) deacylase
MSLRPEPAPKAPAPAAPAATPDELFAHLEALGIQAETHTHQPLFTVAESKALRGELPGAHCKSLFLKDKKGAMWLVVALEDRRLDMKALADLIGSARLSFARPERLGTYLGVEPGAVTPFALINHRGRDNHGIRVILDAEMMQATLVNYHPLVNTATTAVTPADLLRFIADCGHQPNIVDLAPATPTGDR